jgi:hypothetical protein
LSDIQATKTACPVCRQAVFSSDMARVRLVATSVAGGTEHNVVSRLMCVTCAGALAMDVATAGRKLIKERQHHV